MSYCLYKFLVSNGKYPYEVYATQIWDGFVSRNLDPASTLDTPVNDTMSTTLTSLPNEILLQIIGILTPESTWPIIGHGAAWVAPFPSLERNRKVPTHSGVTVDNKGVKITDIAKLQQ
jgi:hypothetical protein